MPHSIRAKLNLGQKLRAAEIFAKFYLGFPLKKTPSKIQFDIHLAEHCNLNCKGCGHFSCIAEPEFLSVDEFKRDMNRAAEIFDHECDNIRLLGGEPLLNPEINTMLKIAREIFTDGVIDIVTNGILLTQMSEDFWRTCHDYKIYIEISHYPIKLDENKIKELADKFGVTCFWETDDLKDKFGVFPIDLSGKQDMRKNFILCHVPTICITLKHGRLYPCYFAAHVHHFNKKFNKNVEITERDYIDIYKDISKREIFKWLTKPVPVCRFCNIAGRHTTNWEISKQDISEWL
ncbi:MAG: radical SAM protein [Synergistaceae bacterium]|nr:radical SAM protein [Synergistaceae bacterium]MBR0096463.1 radical SAM protein [Synergistaceae bacterium]